MSLKTIWRKYGRNLIPPSCYPALSYFYRRDRSRQIHKFEIEDKAFFEKNPSVIVPPAAVRARVIGPCSIDTFLNSGHNAVAGIGEILESNGINPADLATGLDFGCGCGRILLSAMKRWPNIAWSGTDVDEICINWCREHIVEAEFSVNGDLPPLSWPDERFDLIWCGSVFTHLDEERQFSWLEELNRVTSNSGVVLASIHGTHCWENLPTGTVRKIKANGHVFCRTGGDEDIHPKWYQTAWHTESYIRDTWSQYFEILAIVPRGLNSYQDIVVCRKKG